MRYILLGAVLAIGIACSTSSQPGACADLQTLLQRKPNSLHFLGCSQRSDLQGAPFEGKYRTEGKHAAEVEEYLVNVFKIKELRRTCCVWESADNSYRDSHKRPVVISMSTEETAIDERSQWPRIDHFYVTIDLFRDEP